MMWEYVTFEQLYSTPSRNGVTRPKAVRGSGYKMVNMGELFSYDFLSDQQMDRVPMTDRELDNCRLFAGDLLFARQSIVASGAGKCSIVMSVPEETVFESHLIRIRLDQAQACPLFYFYYFQSPYSKMQSLVRQCAQAGIKGSDLAKLTVLMPPVAEQRKISSILYRYDDLITANQRRIQLLEESVRLLYREWFVKLRFPGHETVPVRDGVPVGWRCCNLSELADINPSAISAKDHPQVIKYVDISSVGTGHIDDVEEITFDEAPGRARRRVRHGDIIWSCVRPNRRSYALIWEPEDNLIVSTGFAVLTALTVPFSYLYLACTTDDFVSYLTNQATGAAYPAVTAKDFEKATILLPDQETLAAFDTLVLPHQEQIDTLQGQNRQLREARDLLLPKLMSGALDVSRINVPQEVAA
ncbi:MAG: Type-1 restriction enzyme EcoKI specificity protein [Deltaproteobacteria bacterium ADurb.BinA179]|nr:MAG: Type-1 restriction enzyme EcoKI specificity protein [Deltaproteobacteria bacterium ADurb.BinA179]HOI36868.1 restriction endonuclease subunit S [Bacillota bacterium]